MPLPRIIQRLVGRRPAIRPTPDEPEMFGKTSAETAAELARLDMSAAARRTRSMQGKGFFRAFEPGTALPPEDDE